MQMYGITREELGRFPETVVSGGVTRVWEAWQAFVSMLQEETREEFEAERRKQDAAPLGSEAATRDSALWASTRAIGQDRRDAEVERLEARRSNPAPLWRMVSGLDEDEYALTPGERAGRIRTLLKGIERVARVELRAEDTRCGGDWRAERKEGEERDGRCYAWDPLRSICYYFAIAKSKLGAFSWEVWGLSAPQLVDRVKCETVRAKMRAEMKVALLKVCAENAGADRDELWAAFKESRKGLSYRTALAARMGFSSYSRFFRACVLCYGVEPSALEREVFEAILEEGKKEPGAGVERNVVAGGTSETGVDEVKETRDGEGLGQVG